MCCKLCCRAALHCCGRMDLQNGTAAGCAALANMLCPCGEYRVEHVGAKAMPRCSAPLCFMHMYVCSSLQLLYGWTFTAQPLLPLLLAGIAERTDRHSASKDVVVAASVPFEAELNSQKVASVQASDAAFVPAWWLFCHLLYAMRSML